jgi:hypothetical protein
MYRNFNARQVVCLAAPDSFRMNLNFFFRVQIDLSLVSLIEVHENLAISRKRNAFQSKTF